VKLVPLAALLLLVLATRMAAWVRALNPSRRIRAVRDVGMLHRVSRPFPCPTRMGTRLLSTVLSEETNAPTQRRDNDDNSKENRSYGQKQVNGVAPPSLPAAAAPSHHSVAPHAAASTAAPNAASASLPALRPEPEHEAAPKPPSTLVPPEPLPKRKGAATATLDDEVAPAVTPSRKASMITDDFPITVVDTEEKAREVLRVLESMSVDVPWACDTEVADIDLKEQGPVGNGKVTCVSIYGGPTVDFGTGDGKGSVLWVENIGKADGLLQLFKGWFEDPTRLKVGHARTERTRLPLAPFTRRPASSSSFPHVRSGVAQLRFRPARAEQRGHRRQGLFRGHHAPRPLAQHLPGQAVRRERQRHRLLPRGAQRGPHLHQGAPDTAPGSTRLARVVSRHASHLNHF